MFRLSIVIVSMLVRIKALQTGTGNTDTVTMQVEDTDLTDSLYTLVRSYSYWNFGPALCLSDKFGTHVLSGYALRDYNISDGDWLFAGHGTRQPFSQQPLRQPYPVTTPTATSSSQHRLPQFTGGYYDLCDASASHIASALLWSASIAPELYSSQWKADVIAIAALRSEQFRRVLTSEYVQKRSGRARRVQNRDSHPYAPFVPDPLTHPISYELLWPPPGSPSGAMRTIEVPSTHLIQQEAP